MSKKLTIVTPTKKTKQRSARSVFFINQPTNLYLEDGRQFNGFGPAWQEGSYIGEVVFNTGMTGYVESLTDPSYAGQILVFTYPLIGNYGVQPSTSESEKIQVRGIVVSEAVLNWSHAAANYSLPDWLESQKIPILSGIDTRALTKHLRSKGTMLGAISQRSIKLKSTDHKIPFVSVNSPITYNHRYHKKVILVDCGIKLNILRSLLKLPAQIKRVPYDYDYTNEDFDGVLLSNGPGDPSSYHATIDITRKSLDIGKAIFGICLGSQIMGLAAGARTYKLLYGHRGHNQPCSEVAGKRCYITSQNHGYAVDEASLPSDWRVNFRNLNDQSIEGIEHQTKPFFSVQFHPEACPGPTDTAWLFEKFYRSL